MPSSSFSFVTFAGVLILAIACSSDNPAGPSAPSQLDASNGPLGSAIKSDIAASAGNAIAGDLETLIANEAAAVGSFAVLVPSTGAFGDDAPASPPSNPPATSSGADSAGSNPPSEQPNCTAGNQPGVFLCLRQPGPGDRLQCTYSEEKKLYLCVKQEQPDSNPPSSEPKPPASTPPSGEPAPAPVTESCGFSPETLTYSCVKSGEGQTVVKSYQFLDASGKPMEKFVRGVTEAIHFLVKKDASEASDNSSSVSHSLRDVVESGFLGPNRIYNGFGSSADTNSRKENLSTRKYTGSSVDSLKAVTFVDQRAEHPYPLSGVAIRVVDYAVVATGEQLETTAVHKRVVVTFNGTADVQISLGDYSCVLHLDTHKVDGCK